LRSSAEITTCHKERPNRSLVSKTRPDVLQRLALDLHTSVEDFAIILEQIFDTHRENKLGMSVGEVTDSIFERWCADSGITPLSRLLEEVSIQYKVNRNHREDFNALFVNRNFPADVSSKVADALSNIVYQGTWKAAEVRKLCWMLYEHAVKKLSVQTGHVIVARLLLYRIGEDNNIFPVKISNSELDRSLTAKQGALGDALVGLTLFEEVRNRMEPFLPSIYRMCEFDWWEIPADKRSAISARESATLSLFEKELDLSFRRLLQVLNSYHFKNVDVDVWRNVYQHYLPWEERQRLGGFYTPDELVELVLDLVGYDYDDPQLSDKTFIDPASGSGAFVASALSRLLRHLEKYGPPGMPSGQQPIWVRAKLELEVVEKCLHAVDIHPFAAFLTTLNVLFLVLPKYILVKEKNPQFLFEPMILAHDSLLLTPEEVRLFERFESKMNGRIKRAEEHHKKYVQLLKKKFDFVMGNPPWSGILKGPMAAVYDEQAKKRLKETYGPIAAGKYDIYGIFMARGIHFLKPGGKFGLITQDTYFEKSWAKGLRQKLSNESSILSIVDLNPFGQLFFGAMNTPAVTVCKNEAPSDNSEVLVVMAGKPTKFENIAQEERRQRVSKLLKLGIDEAKHSGRSCKDFIESYTIPQSRLMSTANTGWNLARVTVALSEEQTSWLSLIQLVEPFQGVTPGGQGCLDIFLLDRSIAERGNYESDLLHSVTKGIDVKPWKCPDTGRVIIYPYKIEEETAKPAFDMGAWKDEQTGKIAEGLRLLKDALDFSIPIDDFENDLLRRGAIDQEKLSRLFLHRCGLGIIRYPAVGNYLVSHYDKLQTRVFKKRNIRSFNRQWYEYIWPRDIEVMLQRPKIISPRLARVVRFAMDTTGIVPQDSCIALAKTSKTQFMWNKLRRSLSEGVKREISDLEVYKFLLAFLNSEQTQKLLVTGRRPTPKGSYQISDDFLADIHIPPCPPEKHLRTILEAGDILFNSVTAESEYSKAQDQINKVVEKLIQGK